MHRETELGGRVEGDPGPWSPVAAPMAGDETKPQWHVGCKFSKTVVGKPAKPFDAVDEKYFVPCKPVQRECSPNDIQGSSLLCMDNEPNTYLLSLFNKRG